MKTLRALLVLLLAPCVASAATTIDPAVANSHAYGANVGWINCRGDVTNGAVVGEFICSGYIYSANCGWISLGNGTPANGIRYQNNSATDFGVNTQDYFANGSICEAKLRGFAYSANLGWVSFEATGDPRLNLATGQLLGHAYSANAGWIVLHGIGVTVRTNSLAPGADTDADGIPDNWERFYVGAPNLTLLTATGDFDGDGISDREEYAADTNPFNPNDRLRITDFVPPRQLVANGPFLTDLTWMSTPSRKYSIEISPDLIAPFAPALSNIPPDLGATTFERFDDTPAATKFYRIRAHLPLAP